MPSLRAILSSHAPILLVDAASARIQAGVWSATGSIRWESSDNEASLGVFACVEQLGIKIDSVGGFVFCDGPGSILGIRTVAMALRTWRVLTPRPIWAYRSLDLLVHALGDPAIAAIADARRDRWHVARLGHPMMRVPTAELPRTPLVAPGGFRQWSKLPGGLAVHSAPYDLATLWPRALDADLLHPIDEPEAFLHEEPIYAEWTPQIHRASS